jgi:hypothetical protein
MMEYEIIDNRIFYFKNAIPNHKNIINFISNNNNKFISDWFEWKEFKERGGRSYGFSKEIHGCIADDSEAGTYVKEILNGINTACNIYKEAKQIDFKREWETDFPILKYHQIEIQDNGINELKEVLGGELDAHLDHPDKNRLKEHTILVYYNDDFSGGELFFNKLNKTIKPEAGSIVMFQSVDPLTLHSTHPITNGTKYFTFQLWIDGPGKGWKDKTNIVHPK